MHMQGKPTAPCPPANNTCKQGNGKSRKQRRQHHCHPHCTLAAMPAVTAPPAIAPAPTPVARLQPCWQSQHHLRSHRLQPPLFELATPTKPSISHQTTMTKAKVMTMTMFVCRPQTLSFALTTPIKPSISPDTCNDAVAHPVDTMCPDPCR
jgi:hypothetical protein